MNNCIHRLISGWLVFLLLSAGWCAFALPGSARAGVLMSASPAPDLIIESMAVSPEFPSIGNTVTFSVTFKNQGDASAGTSQLACYIDGTGLSADYIDTIDSGMSATRTFTWKSQSGQHIFRAVIDSENTVAESSESNNEGVLAFSILAPDLVIDSISWTPVNPSAGDTVTFTVNIINQGNKRAGISHLDFLIDGNSRGYRTMPGIEAGASVNEMFTWPAKQGLHNIRAAVDVISQVIESDETNNTAEATCASALPDLMISSLTYAPLNTNIGENITLSCVIKNLNTGIAGPSIVSFYVNDTLRESVVIGFLKTNATSTVSFEWPTENEPGTFKFVLDPNDEIQESDETNNTATIQSQGKLPDLVIQNITWSPASPVINSPMYVTITVKNQGKSRAHNIELKFGIDTIHQFNTIVTELDVGNTTTNTFMWMPLYPSFTVQASADTSGKIREISETNNFLSKKVTATKVVPSADLVVETIACIPSMPVIGEQASVRITVKNRGTGTAAASYATVNFEGKTVEDIFIDKLGAGATLSKDIIIPLQGLAYKDAYRVEVVLDKENIVPETDEFNNRKELQFSISAPDLVIQSAQWTPDVPAAGNIVTFDLIVKNQGDLTAGVTYISYYIDQVFMGKHRIESMETGAAVHMSFPWTAQKGSFQFTAFIDEASTVNEKDESNNTKIIVLPAPDISVDLLTWCPGVPEEFTPITFTARVRNHGISRAPVTALACSYDGAEPIFFETGEIGPGETVSVVFTYAFVSGDHTLKLTADGYNTITENNETNNEITAGFNALSLSGTAVPDSTNTANVTSTTAPVKTAAAKTPAPLKTAPPTNASQDITSNITDSPPEWQTILQNKLLIIGVAAAGVAAIGILLFLRMRAKKKQSQAE